MVLTVNDPAAQRQPATVVKRHRTRRPSRWAVAVVAFLGSWVQCWNNPILLSCSRDLLLDPRSATSSADSPAPGTGMVPLDGAVAPPGKRSNVDLQVLTQLIDRLGALEAASIVLDMPLAEEIFSTEAQAAALVDAMKRSGRVVLAQSVTRGGPAQMPVLERLPDHLTRHAAATGFSAWVAEPDNVVRRIPLELPGPRGPERALALATAMKARWNTETIQVQPGWLAIVGGQSPVPGFPVMADGSAVIDFRGIEALPRIPARSILEDETGSLRDQVRGRIWVVGYEAGGPLTWWRRWGGHESRTASTLGMQAMALERLARSQVLQVPSVTDITPVLASLVTVLLIMALAPWQSLLLVLAGIGGAWLLGWTLIDRGTILSVAGITASLVGSWILLGLESAYQASREVDAEPTVMIAEIRRVIEEELARSDPAISGTLSRVIDVTRIRQLLPPRYDDFKLLGEGGMGVVYGAFDSQLGRPVAIKLVSPLLKSSPQGIQRLIAEAKVLSKLSHPGLVQVLDIQQYPIPYYAMELVEGRSLASVLTREGGLAPLRVATIGFEIAEILAYIHAREIIHRDLKPANVMILTNDSPKLLDFGTARDPEATRLTQTGDLIGTLRYMAPEQQDGQRATAATDVYSLGLILAEMLLAEPPTRAHRVDGTMRRHLVEMRLPEPFIALLERCMQDDPRARPRDGQQLALELDPVIASVDPASAR